MRELVGNAETIFAINVVAVAPIWAGRHSVTTRLQLRYKFGANAGHESIIPFGSNHCGATGTGIAP